MEVCIIEECRDGTVNNHRNKVQYTYKTEDDGMQHV